MTNYTDEQIMIRAMPCPKCFAQPRELCKRKPQKNGIVRNHHDRQKLFHDHIKQVLSGTMVFGHFFVSTTQDARDFFNTLGKYYSTNTDEYNNPKIIEFPYND
jgi:hypothetical protein